MHKLMDLRDKLMEELEKQADRPMTDSTLGLIDRLAHSIKCIDTIVAMEESSYDGGSRDGYSGGYRDGGASGRRGGYFYTQRDDGGTSGRRRRDSMGRYADSYSGEDGMSGRYRDGSRESRYRDGGMSGRRGYSRDEAKDKLVDGLEGMMGEVSPEAQHAIEKAIHVLEQE